MVVLSASWNANSSALNVSLENATNAICQDGDCLEQNAKKFVVTGLWLEKSIVKTIIQLSKMDVLIVNLIAKGLADGATQGHVCFARQVGK